MWQQHNRQIVSGSETGSSLVVSMIMLGVLMLMGVGAVVVSNTQYRMAGNFQFQNAAMASAESALSQAEQWVSVNHTNTALIARVAGGLYPAGTGPDPYTMVWDDTTSEKIDADGTQRYIVEVLAENRVLPSNSVTTCNVYGLSGPCPRVNVYRITARGTSARGSLKLVQTVFTVRVNI
jgi:Tfp pilus assembly protein PilX